MLCGGTDNRACPHILFGSVLRSRARREHHLQLLISLCVNHMVLAFYHCEKTLEKNNLIKKRVTWAQGFTGCKQGSVGPVALGLWWPNASK